ncbi:hypothetical protein V1514DRAFT_321747 [Lipomyces japonicus]|uniref:uncharacterized protein n=1 Tax=Lipomyces japonicus TaxID=56871 RepID=UPI0034CF6758
MTVAKIQPAKPITLYINFLSAWALRVYAALLLANVEFELVEIDFKAKPEGYINEINQGGKVPALKYGDDLLIESAVITEFVAELFPEAKLLPETAFERAQSRLVADRYSELIQSVVGAYRADKTAFAKFLPAVEKFIPYLKINPLANGVNQPLIGDILVAPLAAKLVDVLKEENNKTYSASLASDSKYATFNAWIEKLAAIPGVKGKVE